MLSSSIGNCVSSKVVFKLFTHSVILEKNETFPMKPICIQVMCTTQSREVFLNARFEHFSTFSASVCHCNKNSNKIASYFFRIKLSCSFERSKRFVANNEIYTLELLFWFEYFRHLTSQQTEFPKQCCRPNARGKSSEQTDESKHGQKSATTTQAKVCVRSLMGISDSIVCSLDLPQIFIRLPPATDRQL